MTAEMLPDPQCSDTEKKVIICPEDKGFNGMSPLGIKFKPQPLAMGPQASSLTSLGLGILPYKIRIILVIGKLAVST